MLSRVNTVAFNGLEILDVDLQVQISPGLPAFTIVGLPDNGKRGHACRNLHLKFYVQDFQPVKSDGVHP